MIRAEGASAAGLLLGVSRSLSWLNTAYPFAAVYLLAGGGISAALMVGCAFFLFLFSPLMYGINDVFDFESDWRNPRKGGIEVVVLDTRWHRLTLWWACLLPVPFFVVLMMWGTGGGSAAVLVATLVALVDYSAPDLRFKRASNPGLHDFIDPFRGPGGLRPGACRSGADKHGGGFLLGVLSPGMTSHAFGAVQAVTAHRQAGISSIATVLGAR